MANDNQTDAGADTADLFRDEANEQWDAIDSFLAASLVPQDDVLDALLASSEAEGLPLIQVNPLQARMLWLLARTAGARSALEVGTLGGYSTVWLARAVTGAGRVVSIERDAHFAKVARRNLKEAGVDGVATVEHGEAIDVVSRLVDEGAGPFDFVFLDVDRVNNTDLLPLALKLSHGRTVIVVSVKDLLRETRGMVKFLRSQPQLAATAVQAIGSDGYHGFLVIVPDRH